MISKDYFIGTVRKLTGYDAIVVNTLGGSYRYVYNSENTLYFLRNDGVISKVLGRSYGMLVKSNYLSEPNPRVLILSEEQFLNKFTLTKTQRLFKALRTLNDK